MIFFHITPGPAGHRYIPGRPEARWCFGCQEYTVYLRAWLFDTEPSYYGPLLILECSMCDKDRTEMFFDA